MSLIHHLQEQLSELARHNSFPTNVVVAYSAGIDSHVLLHGLWQLRKQQPETFTLSAIYIDHGLSPKAKDWHQHCAVVCDALNIQFQGATVTVDVDKGKGLEAQARDARYAKLIELAPTDSIVMLAQHQDDQLETVLLQLKRGAGPKGLSGMARFSTHPKSLDNPQQVHFFRPLLDISQARIQAYADEHKLHWQEDDSNLNTDFERNFIRHKINPLLQKRWPQIAQSVSRSAQLCAQQQMLLEEATLDKLQPLRRQRHGLCISGLLKLSEPWRAQVVRLWLSEQGILSPSQAVLAQVSPELLEASEDANPIIRWQNWQLRRFDNVLYVLGLTDELSPCQLLLSVTKPLELPLFLGRFVLAAEVPLERDEQFLLVNNIHQNPVSIAFGGYARRFTPAGTAHSKPLKQWFKLWRIPPWERGTIGMICQHDEVIGLLIKGQLHLAKSTVDAQIYLSDEQVTRHYLCYQSSSCPANI